MPKPEPIPSIDIIRAMMDYHHTRMRMLWDSIMTLTDEQFTTDIPYSHGSVRNHMVHLANVDRGWVRGLRQEPNARSGGAELADYVTRKRTRELWESSATFVNDYLDTLDDTALGVTPKNMPMPVWQTLFHLVNHGTDHRAQVLRILTDFDAPTFDQDAAFHFMGR